MKYLSLFTGIGGFELGIQRAWEYKKKNHLCTMETLAFCEVCGKSNVEGGAPNNKPVCIGYSEIDKYAVQVYQSHFSNHKNYGDITTINTATLPDFDFLCGGFPCQSFSIAGKRGGFSDTRGTLFFEIARILKAKQPRRFLLENVKGLLSHDNGQTFRTIISTLDELGYDCQWQVLNSKNHGVPQNRERVFIVGHLRGTPRPQVFPLGESNGGNNEPQAETQGERKRIRSNIASTLAARDYKGGGNLIQLNNPTHSNDRVYGADGISPTLNTMQGGMRQPFVAIRNDGMEVEMDVANSVTPDAYLTSGKRGLDEDGKSQLTSMCDRRIRRLTPTECERLQGFPDGWTENGLSSIMEVCVNINPAIEKRLLQLDTVSNITSDGSGIVIPISQNESKEPVNIVLHELLLEDGAISTINHGNAIATLFNRRGTLLNAMQLKESLILGKTVEKSTYKLWKVSLVGHYEKEKLSTILTWINETMQSITSISARTDESIIGVIILLNSQELNYSNGESLCLRMGNIESISDTQRYKCCGNAVTVNVIRDILKKLLD